MSHQEIINERYIREELARKEIERQELSFDDFVSENGHCDFYTSIELLSYLETKH